MIKPSIRICAMSTYSHSIVVTCCWDVRTWSDEFRRGLSTSWTCNGVNDDRQLLMKGLTRHRNFMSKKRLQNSA